MSPGDPMHIDYKDYVTIKYSPGGAPLWIARYDGPGHQDDDPSAIRVDASGNVYVTGDSFFGPSEAKNFMTIKYSPSGTALWYAPYNNPALSNNDYGYDLVVDGSGNVFVTGVTIGMGSVVIKDYATVKYSSTGVQVWANVYSGPAYDDIPSGITLDPSGNVIVTGRSDEPGSSHDFDYCTIKYSTAGAQVWVARFVGPGVDDEPTAIIADMSGNVFVTGKSHGPSHYDYQTIEYNSSGVQVWSSRYNGPDPSSNDQASSIALCPDGRPVVTGFSSTSVFGPSSYDYLTIKYSPMVTGVTGNQNEAPDNFGLSQNYPNPFNPSTTIRYQIPNSGLVKLAVYDMLGKQVTILVNDIKDAGSYEIRFDGSKLSSGVYFYKLETDNFSDVKRMNLVK
jgi:hypothetical protein